MTQVPVAIWEKLQLLKVTVELSAETVITGSAERRNKQIRAARGGGQGELALSHDDCVLSRGSKR